MFYVETLEVQNAGQLVLNLIQQNCHEYIDKLSGLWFRDSSTAYSLLHMLDLWLSLLVFERLMRYLKYP